MTPFHWRGVFPALTTKFTDDDRLDFDRMGEHLDFQLDAGVHGIIILGSLGENSTLSFDEKLDMIRFFAGELDGRAPLVPCIAESGTREALALARAGVEAGADGFMLLPPMRYQSDRRETLHYLRTVASSVDAPIMLYNNPLAYGIDLLPEDFEALADLDNVVAIKESSADTRRILDIRRTVGERFAIFCGVDDLAYEALTLGADGWVAGLVVAFPAETVRLWDLAQARRWEEARELYEWFLPLLHLDVGPRFVQQIKLVEQIVGVGSARMRPPRLELDREDAARVRAIVATAMDARPPA